MREYIDVEGELVGPGDLKLRIALRGEALERYLVVNCGYAAVVRTPVGFTVKLRPSIASGPTLAGILYRMADLHISAVTLDSFAGGWQRRHFFSFASFATFIGAIQPTTASRDWIGDRHLRRPVPLASSHFAAIEHRARIIAANVHAPDAAVVLLSKLLAARWSICILHPSQNDSVLLARSANYTPFDSHRWVGLSQYADKPYGQAIVQLHHQTAASMTPRVDHVDAVASFNGLGDVRMRYESLTLPVLRTDGSTVLVCGSRDNSTIDLRQTVNKKAL